MSKDKREDKPKRKKKREFPYVNEEGYILKWAKKRMYNV